MGNNKVSFRTLKDDERETIYVFFCPSQTIMDNLVEYDIEDNPNLQVMFSGSIAYIDQADIDSNGIDVDTWEDLVYDYEEDFCVVVKKSKLVI